MNNAPYQPPGAPPPPGMPPFRADAPGKVFLLVAGILLIIFSAIGFFTTISTIATTNLWLWQFGGPAMRGTWMFIYVLNLLRMVFGVGIGIMAVTSCNKIDKGSILFVLGIIFLVVTIIYSIVYNGLIISFGAGALLGLGGIIGIPLSLVVPILLIIGASRNKKAAEAAARGGHHRGY